MTDASCPFCQRLYGRRNPNDPEAHDPTCETRQSDLHEIVLNCKCWVETTPRGPCAHASTCLLHHKSDGDDVPKLTARLRSGPFPSVSIICQTFKPEVSDEANSDG